MTSGSTERKKLDLSHHLIGWKFGLLALKGRQGTFPFLPTDRRGSGFNPINN
jgi:hypothetical protein